MQTPERKIKDKVKKFLTEKGAYWFMPVPCGYGRVGVPDFIVCWKGRFIAIETKAPGKTKALTANQEREIEEIKKANGIAVVIDDVKKLEEIFIDNS